MNTIYSITLQNGEKLDKSAAKKLKQVFVMNDPKYKLTTAENDYYSIIIRWKIVFIVTKEFLILVPVEER